MYRSVGFRINLTHSQARRIGAIQDSQRFAYNWAVERLLADQTLTWHDLRKEFTILRRATPWLRDVQAAYQYAAIHQARTACDISNRHGNGGLKHRSKKHHNAKAVVCDSPPKLVDNHAASLPGLGRVRLCEGQPYQYPHHWLHGARSFRLVDVTPKSWARTRPEDRTYRLYVTYKQRPEPGPRHATGVVVGIDRGITNPTVVCRTDGRSTHITCHDTATAFRANQTWNDATRRTVSRRNRHSRSTRKMKLQRKRYNEGNANDREYAEWLLSKKVCEGADAVCVEGLHLEAMTRRGGRHKRGLNRGMRFIRHGAILRKIRIVAERLGIPVIDVDPRNTSTTCRICGYVDRENRKGEAFRCAACSHMDNADGNAAANVVQRGTGIKVPAGGGMTLERREMGRPGSRLDWRKQIRTLRGGASTKREIVPRHQAP